MDFILGIIFIIFGGFFFGTILGIIDKMIGYKNESNVLQTSVHCTGRMLYGILFWLVMHNGLRLI